MNQSYAQLVLTHKQDFSCKSDAHTPSDVQSLKHIFELITQQPDLKQLLMLHMVVPLRTTAWKYLMADCFFPLSTHYLELLIKNVTPLMKKIIKVAFMIFDLTTSPLRLLTLIPWVIYQTTSKKEHELFNYLKTKGIVFHRSQYTHINVCFFEATNLTTGSLPDTLIISGINQKSKLDLTYPMPLASSIRKKNRSEIDAPTKPVRDIGLDETIPLN